MSVQLKTPFQGTLARESHHLQHAQSASDERVAVARKQTAARSGAPRLEDVGADAVASAEHGLAASALAESFAR